MARTSAFSTRQVSLGLLFSLSSGLAMAVTPKEPSAFLDHKAFYRPDLSISTSNAPLQDVLAQLMNRGAWEGFLLARGDDPRKPRTPAWIDPRSGAATNLVGAFPLIPGRGVGNRLTLGDLTRTLGRPVSKVDGAVVAALVHGFAEAHRDILGIDVRQLAEARATEVTPDLWQVSIPQEFRGVRVRDARLVASISHGNLG